jgi:SAM-dependent methyltransferase
MVKYFLTASVLKLFSCSPLAKRAYRKLGNTLGARKRIRGRMPRYYVDRVNRILRLNRSFGIFRDGDRLLELGTGWLHWDAIAVRLFFDIEGVLFDVWDNRQLAGLKNFIHQLDGQLENLDTDETRKKRAHGLIDRITRVEDFEGLYDLLGFRYVVIPSGKTTALESSSFDVAVSSGVLEHIHVDILPEFVGGISALLKPGGYSIHSINLRDHLYSYDRSVSVKQYLRYPDGVWKRWFENEVQYINRVQRPRWAELFRDAGLELVGEEVDNGDISGLKIADEYLGYDGSQLQCTGLRILHRKPGAPEIPAGSGRRHQ